MDEEDGGEWLVTNLPSLPHFSTILPRVCHPLLQACLVETNLRCLCNYIFFVTQHTPRELLFDSSIGISQILIDRFDIFRKLFQPCGGESRRRKRRNDFADMAMDSLVTMLCNTLNTAVNSQSAPPHSSSDDFLVVTFCNGKKAFLHLALIQATFLLLSCDSPSDATGFNHLLNMWFSEDSTILVQACALESGDEVTLMSPFVLQSMLYSSVPRVVSAAVKMADVSQLCTCVELYGFPIQSVEGVLEKLDLLTSTASDAIREVVKNPGYLCELVEVQLLRGSKFGSVFLMFLQKMAGLPQEGVISDPASLLIEDAEMEDAQPVSKRPSKKKKVATLPQDGIKQLLVRIFTPSLDRVPLAESDLENFEEALKVHVSSSLANCSSPPAHEVTQVVSTLHQLVTTDVQQKPFIEGLIRNRFSLTLFRRLARILSVSQRDDEATRLFRATLRHLLSSIDSYRSLNRRDVLSFAAVLQSSAEQLGIKHLPSSTQSYHKVEALSRKTLGEVCSLKNPFLNEAALVKKCKHLLESNAATLEEVVNLLAKKAILTGREPSCLELLAKLQGLARTAHPITLRSSPEVFHGDEVCHQTEASSVTSKLTSTGKHIDSTSSSPISLDINGLLVDWLALLDPEILALSSQSILRIVFGQSHPETPHSLLATGQGFLLACLVHAAAWPTITRAVSALLEPGNHKEW